MRRSVRVIPTIVAKWLDGSRCHLAKRLVGWGLTALLTQNRSYRACGKEVGLNPGHIVLYGDPVGTQPPHQPLPTSAHVYCGQTVAHLSNC